MWKKSLSSWWWYLCRMRASVKYFQSCCYQQHYHMTFFIVVSVSFDARFPARLDTNLNNNLLSKLSLGIGRLDSWYIGNHIFVCFLYIHSSSGFSFSWAAVIIRSIWQTSCLPLGSPDIINDLVSLPLHVSWCVATAMIAAHQIISLLITWHTLHCPFGVIFSTTGTNFTLVYLNSIETYINTYTGANGIYNHIFQSRTYFLWIWNLRAWPNIVLNQ